jgi:hypothetical protein
MEPLVVVHGDGMVDDVENCMEQRPEKHSLPCFGVDTLPPSPPMAVVRLSFVRSS